MSIPSILGSNNHDPTKAQPGEPMFLFVLTSRALVRDHVQDCG